MEDRNSDSDSQTDERYSIQMLLMSDNLYPDFVGIYFLSCPRFHSILIARFIHSPNYKQLCIYISNSNELSISRLST